MARAIMLVLDSLGIGSSADAGRFDDRGADTFGHIAEASICLLYTSPSPRDKRQSRMPSSA